MDRTAWKAFHRSIRADARAFKRQQGGYPSFARRLTHNGREWTLQRWQDGYGCPWRTDLRPSLVIHWPRVARLLGECGYYRADYTRRRWPDARESAKRGLRATIKEARAHRTA